VASSHGEWMEILSAGAPDSEVAAVRRATTTGEPLGSTDFLEGLERQAGRRLRVQERGRPRRKPESKAEAAAASQASLLAGGEGEQRVKCVPFFPATMDLSATGCVAERTAA
jgi:hypothetical protein